MRSLTLTAVLILTIGVIGAHGQINEILKRMNAHYKALNSFSADVQREVRAAGIEGAQTSAGDVLFVPDKRKPGNLRFRLNWTSPRAQSLSVLNGQYLLYLPALSRQIRGMLKSASLESQGISAIRMYSNRPADLKTSYSIAYKGIERVGAVDTFHISLTPKAKGDNRRIELWVDGNGMAIQCGVVFKNGAEDQISLTNIRKNIPVTAAHFKIEAPPGTQLTSTTSKVNVEEILLAIGRRNASLTSLRADLRRTVFNSQLRETDNYSGKVLFARSPKYKSDPRVRINWTKPRIESLTIANRKYELYVPAQGRVLTGSVTSRKGLSTIDWVRSQVFEKYKDPRLTSDVFFIDNETVESVRTKRLLFVPHVKEDRFEFAEIWADTAGNIIKVRLTFENRDTDETVFSNLRPNDKYSESEFRLAYPRNIQKVTLP